MAGGFSIKRNMMHAVAYSECIAVLFDGPHNVREIAEESGLHEITVRRLTHALRRRKLVRIGRWDKDVRGRVIVPAYEFSKKADVPKPTPITDKERQQRRRDRLTNEAKKINLALFSNLESRAS